MNRIKFQATLKLGEKNVIATLDNKRKNKKRKTASFALASKLIN